MEQFNIDNYINSQIELRKNELEQERITYDSTCDSLMNKFNEELLADKKICEIEFPDYLVNDRHYYMII